MGAGVAVMVEDNEVFAVECHEKLYYDSFNLISKPTIMVLDMFKTAKWRIQDEDEYSKQFVSDDLGAILWDEDGVVEAITVSGND